jgi:hypothetical protein
LVLVAADYCNTIVGSALYNTIAIYCTYVPI